MKKFYLRNYRSIHHAFTLMLFIFFIVISGHEDIMTSFPRSLMILGINYFIVKLCLRHSGIDEEAQRQLEEMEKEKEQK